MTFIVCRKVFCKCVRSGGFSVALAVALVIAAIATAANTKLAFSWRNPAFTGGNFKNIMVLAVNGKSARRADFEDRMVSALEHPGIQVVQSYSLLPRPEDTPIDQAALRDVVNGQHFDAILVSRLTKYDKTTNYVPGDTRTLPPQLVSTFYGYYTFVTPVVYTPGYMQTDTKAQIETNLYSTAGNDGQLVWTCTSSIFNPRSPNAAIDAVVKLVVKELAKQQVI